MPLLVSLSGEGTSSPSARAAESPSTAPTCSSAAAARTARRRSPRCSRPPREQASTAARTSRLWGRSASSSGWPWRQPLRTRPEATYSDLPVLLPLFPVPFEDQKRRERLKPFAALISPPTSTLALTGHREGSAESCACPTPSCALHFGPGASPMPPAAVMSWRRTPGRPVRSRHGRSRGINHLARGLDRAEVDAWIDEQLVP